MCIVIIVNGIGVSWNDVVKNIQIDIRNASPCIMVKEVSNLNTVYMDILPKQWHPKKIWELSSPMT